jgi:hypothetical protein
MRWAWLVVHIGLVRNACSILVGKSEGNRLRGRPGIDMKIILE